MPGIVIVGAGFGGIGMGIALKKAGYHDFVILDKAGDLGGTWRDNQYPGCACDVPSPLYSYSFELNPDWSHLFAPQQEIWDYLRNCARKYHLDEHVRYGTAVERMDWDDRARRWNVETVRDGELESFHARAVVSAAGALHRPSYPDIPGAGRFGGTAFHSARWDRSCDLTGRRVAVEALGRRHLKSQVTDPALRARLTPDYTIGCKRILLSSDYYPALQRPNVSLVTDDITGITEHGVVAGAEEHAADVIIYATGFKVIESVTSLNVAGRDGRKLAPETLEAYRGVTVTGFPNLFLLLGPNTGLGHTSVVFMIESQIQHVLSCLRILAKTGADTIEVSEAAQQRYNDALQQRLRRAVWSEGSCDSWYLDATGVNRTLWPGFTFEYWARTRRARRADYAVTGA